MSNKFVEIDDKVVLKEDVKEGCRGGGKAEGEDGRLGWCGIGVGVVECVWYNCVMMMGWFEDM